MNRPRDPAAGDDGDDGGPDALDALAADYVLGTLPASDRRAVEARLPGDAALRDAVDGWEARLLPLTALAAPVDPSDGLWPRIAGSVRTAPAGAGAATRDASSAPEEAAAGPARRRASRAGVRWWDSLALWRGLSGGGFAMAAVLAALLLGRGGLSPTAVPQYLVVLVAPQDQAPGWVVQASTARQVSLIPLATAAVPQGRTLQFWTKGADWRGPVSLGLVQPGQVLRVPLDKLPPLEPNQLFELTLEPAGGSPLDRPTGPIQFIGRAVKVA
jgi:anti-sigma-K factor RskA